MTSLQLFHAPEQLPSVPKEWGTGRYKEEVDVFVPKAPTWQYSGKPLEQLYKLTHLKLSNIRSNDELVPEPHEIPIGPQMINKTFPADHPYSSHIPRTALFPTFDSSEDPKRGVSARHEQPISDEMPATAADSLVVHKTKGFGARHEIVAHPHASEKKGLEWVGEKGFNQLVKVHDGRQEFYPIPLKTVAPNLQARGPEMRLSQRSANALRNIERDQWQTTYDRSNTGLGPTNPNKLDNLAEKTQFYDTYGIMDDKLYPRSINTLDPPRPQEGRIGKMLVPRPPPLKTADAANAPEDPNYVRMQALSEREEQRLLLGKDYVSLPTLTPEEEDERWKELQNEAHQDPNLERVDNAKAKVFRDDVPFHPAGAPSGEKEAQYLDSTKRDQDKNFQEIEAQNRWKVLDAHGPAHDITSLNYKMGHVHDEERPSTFYGHEGKFNEERAGLYKTNYSPERLAYNMNALDVSGPETMNTMHSHKDAIDLPSKLNHDMKDAFRFSRTLSTSQPNLSGDRRETRELMNQHDKLKHSQKLLLQPTVENARVKVQEGGILLKDSETGDNFNTRKFLQEYDIGKFSRYEPLKVMSKENQNLHNVRRSAATKSGKSVKFSDTVSVATSLDSGQLRFSSAPTRGSPRVGLGFNSMPALSNQAVAEPEKGEVTTTQYTSRQALYNPGNELDKQPKPQFTVFNIQPKESNTKGMQSQPLPAAGANDFLRLHLRRPATSDPGTEHRDEFGSKATNFIPSNLQNSLSFSSAYDSQFPMHDIGYKHDPRFEWQPGFGVPRPQTHLLKIQNRFEKSAVRRSFHNQFQETNPDLRQNIVKGKKHDFYGLNGQLLHG